MTRYLLDTSTLIDYSKGVTPTRTRVLGGLAAGDEMGVCAVVVAEFEAGLYATDRPAWERFLSDSLYYWPISLAAAQAAGVARFTFARRGIALSTTDTLIAAVAREQGAIIVTENSKDFPQPDVQLVSFRQ